MELPDGLPPKLDPPNDEGDPELYMKMVAIHKDHFVNLVGGFQLKVLSEMLGKSAAYVGKIKRGETKMIPYETADNLAGLLSCNVCDFGELTDASGTNHKSVICIETGEVFGTTKAAADSIGVNIGCIGQSIRLGCKSGGYHWKYAEEKEAENED